MVPARGLEARAPRGRTKCRLGQGRAGLSAGKGVQRERPCRYPDAGTAEVSSVGSLDTARTVTQSLKARRDTRVADEHQRACRDDIYRARSFISLFSSGLVSFLVSLGLLES